MLTTDSFRQLYKTEHPGNSTIRIFMDLVLSSSTGSALAIITTFLKCPHDSQTYWWLFSFSFGAAPALLSLSVTDTLFQTCFQTIWTFLLADASA